MACGRGASEAEACHVNAMRSGIRINRNAVPALLLLRVEEGGHHLLERAVEAPDRIRRAVLQPARSACTQHNRCNADNNTHLQRASHSPCVEAPHTSQPKGEVPWPAFAAAAWSAQQTSPSLLS